ncbi:MAG: sugar ABC transporter permease [Clostridia bacterium]|nr:sugar ABC transporter permease [Clostridia bacterium]
MNAKPIVDQKYQRSRRDLIVNRNRALSNVGKKVKRSKYLILMIIPAIIYYLVFCYAPMYGILIAFKRFLPSKGIMASPWASMGGFGNFAYIFEDEKFWQVLGNTVLIGTCKILISFVAAILVAVLINEIRMRVFKKSVQIIVTFPHFLSWVIIGGLIANIFGTTGIVNNVIAAMGGERFRFLADGKFFMGLIFASDVWKEAGWSSIIYLATMAGISPELYEAADIDGATRLQKIFNITLPAIKPTAILLLILSVGGVLSAGFDQILNMYNPLVYNVADILDTYIYRSTLREMQPAERGAAIGLFKSVVSFILVLVVDRIAKLSGERGII